MTADQFWERLDRSGQCWLWTRAMTRGGYGNASYQGRFYRAHRLAWLLTFGEVPAGVFVLHSCDNPACVRPSHLFLGTQKDNIRDMVAKGRLVSPLNGVSGPAHPRWQGGYETWKVRHNERRRQKRRW